MACRADAARWAGFPFREGVEFALLETRGDWLHIRLRNGDSLEGWIPAADAVTY